MHAEAVENIQESSGDVSGKVGQDGAASILMNVQRQTDNQHTGARSVTDEPQKPFQ